MPEPAQTGNVQAGLDAQHHAGFERPVVTEVEKRTLVDALPEAVADVVPPVLPQVLPVVVGAHRLVDLRAGAPRFQRLEGDVLQVEHVLEEAPLLGVGLTDEHGPFEFADVAPDGGPRSRHQGVAQLKGRAGGHRVWQGAVRPDLPPVERHRAGHPAVLAPVGGPQLGHHGGRGLCGGARLGRLLGLADAGIVLQPPVREGAPAGTLANQGEFGRTLQGHLVVQRARHPRHAGQRQLGAQRRAVVAHDAQVPVVVHADPPGVQAQPRQQVGQKLRRMNAARKLRVIGDLFALGGLLGVFAFQSGHEQRPLAVPRDEERHGPLGGKEGEAGVVEDVLVVEQHQGVHLRRQMVERLPGAR